MPPRKVSDLNFSNGLTARLCGSCREWLPLNEDFFHCSRSVNSLSGFSPQCINCHKQSNKRGGKKFRLKVRNLVFYAYGGKTPSCSCCGEIYNEFLSIDHINGGGREHRQEINGHTYEWLVKNNFPSGFRILCHNCNFSLGMYGYCPHQKLVKNPD